MFSFLYTLQFFGCSCAEEEVQDTAILTVDIDQDGITTEEGDCDDTDPNIGIIDDDGDGFSACNLDCDDSDAFAHPGAAEAESDSDCMRDADEDGWGDREAPGTGVAGTDCNDSDSSITGEDGDGDGILTCEGDCDDNDIFTFTGAAEAESETECMRDADEDGWGDTSAPEGGSEGTDCDDTDPTLTPADVDGDGLSSCEGDCDDVDPDSSNEDADGDGYTVCDGDLEDDNPAIAFFSPSGATFASILPDTFEMGSPLGEIGREGDEILHTVTLTRAFLCMNKEVTQGQFALLMGYNPAYHLGSEDLSHPVENVSWHEAASFSNAMSEAEGLNTCYNCTGEGINTACIERMDPYDCGGYRLPTEAEWEYVARAGTEKTFWTNNGGGDFATPGDAETCSDVILNDGTSLAQLAWYCGNTLPETHLPGLLYPNSFAIFDMYGNLSEWVHDSYDAYASEAVENPYQSTGEAKVIRGGSFDSPPEDLRSANRRSLSPLARDPEIGFRVVRTAPF